MLTRSIKVEIVNIVIFCTFVIELWPLIEYRISFPLNILTANGQKLTKFSILIDIDKSMLGLLTVIFRNFVAELQPLIDIRRSFLPYIL